MKKKKIFVYGTLLEGFGNWNYYLNNDASVKLGDHTAEGNFTMVSLHNFPAVIPHDKGNTPIVGEVYEVSEAVYKNVERLEGFMGPNSPHNLYNKQEIKTPWGEADMYVMDEKSLSYPKVENGDWKSYIN